MKLVDAVCTKRLDEIDKIKVAYKDMYGRHLTKDIKIKISGKIGRILLSMVNINRQTKVNLKLAQAQAKIL